MHIQFLYIFLKPCNIEFWMVQLYLSLKLLSFVVSRTVLDFDSTNKIEWKL